jgi:MerC mercury resistance protein
MTRIRDRLDRIGVLLSCLCLIHCVLGLVLVAGLGVGAGALLDPSIHRVGLLLATVVAAVAIGVGAIRHRRENGSQHQANTVN